MKNLPHFSSLHTESFALTSLQIQGLTFGKKEYTYFFFVLLPVEFQQFQAILGHNKYS